jgi:uncharacterized protein (DUF952 family)
MSAPDGARSRPAACGRSNEVGHACTRGQGYRKDGETCACKVSGASAEFHPTGAVWLRAAMTTQRDEAASMPVTFHLTLREHWEAQCNGPTYVPESFADEGFIHCTNGEENVIAVGNRYYTGDPREMVCLVLDVARITAEIRYEDSVGIYPHLYGELNVDSVIAVRRVVRDHDGQFLRLAEPIES